MKVELSNLEENMRLEITKITNKFNIMNEKVEDLLKLSQERRPVMNIPVSFDKVKTSGGKLDDDAVIDALEKMRDFI